jgi:phage terminase small subunit
LGGIGSGGRRDGAAPTTAQALTRWPSVPASFTDAERQAWRRLGKALLPLNTIGPADLMSVELVARAWARCDKLLSDPDAKPTAVNAAVKQVDLMLRGLGLVPAARSHVNQLPVGQVEDDLSEFE